eukprot:CAMPEP_0178419124 /NCGR_PEP_ID=MMETSP0689_2-20121128/25446_1 /TAXON_ID=160604 /ORGANISM="Amphidinium massartii, Strain CS-259" /LENGTH=323 /DNA_ID=CAMNT_0020040547 /DNA_START=28 /DNA_END=999 /DNA_ORIENTATION=-
MKGETEALAACLAEGFAWLSTTGGPLDEESASESRGCVLLEPIEPGTSGAPVIEKVLFGPGFNDVINVGRDDGLDVPLDLRAVSKVHCQFLLRTFRWSGDDPEKKHEAFFLRDVSRNGTLVNGVAAVRPLHWLQDGDVIGVFRAPNDPQVQDCWKVVYIKLDRLRNKEHDAPEVPSKGKSAPVASHETQSGKASQPKTKAPTTGAGKAKAKAKAKMPEVRILAEDVVGDIIDIRYVEPDETFRVKVVRYDVESKYHQVDSTGYSTWDGESFDDTLDLNEFYQAGRLTFIEVDDSEGATAGDKAQTATSLPPKKKARMTNKRSA